MTYDLLVEVSEELEPELRHRLLSLAYRASRSREVALVLRGVSRKAVDRNLDPIVRREGTTLAGVRYVDPAEVGALLQQNIVSDPLLVSRDAGWLSDVDGHGPRVRSPEEGIAILEEELVATGAG